MLYWLIPYLVAYNASGDWKYGPEHVFKAEMYLNATISQRKIDFYTDIVMDFTCRPMNSSLIQCRVDSTTANNYELATGSNLQRKTTRGEEFKVGNIIFQVLFNEEGISRFWFLNTNDMYLINIIRAIIEPMNIGTNIADKKFGNYVSLEKSIVGLCDTSFNIRKKLEKEDDNETVIEGYKFDLPSLDGRLDDATIVIEKDRNPFECREKTPYFFGETFNEKINRNSKNSVKIDKLITYSKSRIYLGEKSFSAYTENIGETMYAGRKLRPLDIKLSEKMRISLQSIRSAKEELRDTGNSLNVGVGFQPGTPWPGGNSE